MYIIKKSGIYSHSFFVYLKKKYYICNMKNTVKNNTLHPQREIFLGGTGMQYC